MNDRRAEKWWTSSRFGWSADDLRREYVVNLTLLLSRLFGRALARPRYAARGEAERVTRWLADKARRGKPAVLETNHSTAVRICLAAKERGIDIGGTAFHVTGEPLTPAKAEVIAAAGVRAIDRYSNVEVGFMALACADATSFDDLHLVSDKLALIERERTLPGGGETVNALVFTTLVPCTPKLWLNVENGDYASVSRRDCGCPFGELGLDIHLSGVRAFDKLTSEGVTLPGIDLFDLMERVLPARFGGGPTDYQFVEEEEAGLPKVCLVIRPSVGAVDETSAIAAVHEAIRSVRGAAQMAEEWRQAGSLRVVRRAPSRHPRRRSCRCTSSERVEPPTRSRGRRRIRRGELERRGL